MMDIIEELKFYFYLTMQENWPSSSSYFALERDVSRLNKLLIKYLKKNI